MKLISHINKLFILFFLSIGATSSYAGLFDDWTDNQLCVWMDQPSPPGAIQILVNKRKIFCSGGIVSEKVLIVTSDAFDGKYAFKLISNPPNITKHQIGSGYFEIKSGLMTVSTQDRVLSASSNKFVTNKYYNNFYGRIDANGEIQANFFFNPCANGSKCYVQKEGQYNVAINDDKNITISGNIKTHKLAGEFTKGSGPDIVKIIFEIED